jgi:hypothetical protein
MFGHDELAFERNNVEIGKAWDASAYWQASQVPGFSRLQAIAATSFEGASADSAASAFEVAEPARVLVLATVAFAIFVAGRDRR